MEGRPEGWDGTHVSGHGKGAAHDDELFDAQEGHGIAGGSKCDVGQWADGHDGDGVGRIRGQRSKDLLVGGKARRRKR